MAKNKLEKVIAESAGEFALEIVKAIKESSLQELIALQAAPKKRGRKPGPKTNAKPGRKKKPGRPKKLVKATTKKKGKRISSADKAKILDNIVTHLKENPESGCKVIAKKFKLPSVKMGVYLKELRTKGKVKTTGKAVKMTYSAK